MRLAISAQERPARNALTVVVSYVNPTRKPVVDAARSSAHPVYRCIKACTRKEPQRTTAKISLAKAHSCAGVVRVRFMDRKERVKCPRLLYQSQCKFSVDVSGGMGSGAGDGV